MIPSPAGRVNRADPTDLHEQVAAGDPSAIADGEATVGERSRKARTSRR